MTTPAFTPEQAARVADALLSKETAAALYAFAHQVEPGELEMDSGDGEGVDELHRFLQALAARAAGEAGSGSILEGSRPGSELAYDTPGFVTEGLELLDEAIGTVRGDWSYGNGSITSNNGAEPFENDVFVLRSFCWCFGDLHPDECPPNFEHKATGVKAEWYKHARRGDRINHPVTLAQWEHIQSDCLTSLGITLADIDARREAETATCKRCGKKRAEYTTEDAGSVRRRGECVDCAVQSYMEFSAEMAALTGEDG